MRIGVFGDGFADRNPYNPESPFKEDESWIADMENAGHKITTYGKTGSSTWYSFQQFLAHHEQFDHIIFCYSSLHRIHHLPEGLEDLSFLTTPDELYALRRNKGLSKQQELEMTRILTEAHQLPFGDVLLEYLKLMKDALFSHVHNGSGNPPTDLTISGNKQALAAFKSKADSLEKAMLSRNVRIN